MSVKKYFKRQFQIRKFFLEHDVVSDFYVSSFQRNRSIIPLLLLRGLIFVGCLSIVISSMVMTARAIPFKFWPIYLTHWGIVLNTIAAGFGLIISARIFIKGPIEASLGLPWYVKAYWGMANMATPIAFFITIFYWALLSSLEQEFAINPTLDVFIHAINSVLMLLLLILARHPVYLLHFYFAIGIGLIYLVFTVIYYVAGGTDAFGQTAIYPMIDWSKPGETVGILLLSALGILIMHGLTVALSAGRDALGRRYRKENTAYEVDESFY